jgi:hypothetical protein
MQGSISVGETLEVPSLKLTKPVKSMQMFKRPVTKAVQVRVACMPGDSVHRGVLQRHGREPVGM